MRLSCISTQSLFPTLLVNVKVSFADMDIPIALKGDDMSGKSIKKPSIMSDNHDTAGKVCDALF
jgi:hypothetical protein